MTWAVMSQWSTFSFLGGTKVHSTVGPRSCRCGSQSDRPAWSRCLTPEERHAPKRQFRPCQEPAAYRRLRHQIQRVFCATMPAANLPETTTDALRSDVAASVLHPPLPAANEGMHSPRPRRDAALVPTLRSNPVPRPASSKARSIAVHRQSGR